MPQSAMMDDDICNVIYVDRDVYKNRLLRSPATDLHETGDLRANLNLLLNTFGHVHLCKNGVECMEKIADLHNTSMVELKPTLVLIDTPHAEEPPEVIPVSRDPSPCSKVASSDHSEDDIGHNLYGLALLEKIVYETHLKSLSKLVVPIPVVGFPSLRTRPSTNGIGEDSLQPTDIGCFLKSHGPSDKTTAGRALVRRCLDSGAVDVMASPIHVHTLTTLEGHAYRAHREASKDQQALIEIRRGRKRSWVGIHEKKPFAYLREAMVSGLMGGICRSGEENESRISAVRIDISPKRRMDIEEALGKWHFCAPCYDDDSLLIAAALMFEHALAMPELEKWRIPTDQLTTFLVACRAAYNQFVPYHNFRHAVDVLQATFDFLIHIGALPPYRSTPQSLSTAQRSQITCLLKPFEALTLLVSAIGHDVGHPGVNNGFLVTLNAPLAQLYNDRSVLESFHCAAYSQILRRHWPRVFEDREMRTLMISSILATDMGLHFDYMKKLNELQKEIKSKPSIDEWSDRTREEQKALICSLLIKCADISNVARRYDAALQWMNILCDEFSRQATMEEEIGIKSSLIQPPKKDFRSLAKAQLGFVKLFAIPLFQGVAEILPQMQYTVSEVEKNTGHFEMALEKIQGMDEDYDHIFTQQPLDSKIMKMVENLAANEKGWLGIGSTDLAPASSNQNQMREAGSAPPYKLTQVPDMSHQYKEINALTTSFGNVTDYTVNGAFHSGEREDGPLRRNEKQRSSNTTEGSSSVPCSGDWQSQATSATGKLPLSPSTQGTSIVSQDSVERPSSDPITTVTAPDSSRTTTPIAVVDSTPASEEESNGTLKPDGTLKKKTSRFRMNVSNLFRRNKGASSPASVGSGS